MGRRSKEEMIIAINNLIAKMRSIYPEANIRKEALKIQMKYVGLPYSMIKEAFDWVTAVFYGEYDSIIKIKKLLPQKVWTRYKEWGLMDDSDLTEVRLLKQRLKAFHKVVTSISRPDFFKRTKVNGYFRKTQKTKRRVQN